MITRTLVFGDVHLPFHDKDNLDLVLNVAEDLSVDRIICNGDFIDFYAINSHNPKHPVVKTTLQDEMIAGREFFEDLRKRFPKTEIIFNKGNHENRLDRFIIKNAKQFFDILTIENFIDFNRLEIEVFPYNNRYQIEDTACFVQHSPPSYSSPMACLKKKFDETHIYSCTHRVGHGCVTGSSGKVYDCFFLGWFGSTNLTPEHSEVFSFPKGHENWQTSFAIVTVIDKTEHHINSYNIRNKKVVCDGHLYGG